MELATAKAVISGGASGLGLATAQRVIAAGGHVTLLDINDEQGEAQADALGRNAGYVRTDVANEESVRAAIAAAADLAAYSATKPRSFPHSTGLVVYSSQPASKHFCRSESMAFAVRAMIGPRYSDCLSLVVAPYPSNTGICISIKMTSKGLPCSHAAIACS